MEEQDALLYGLVIGGAWVLRELFPLIKRSFGNGHAAHRYVSYDRDAEREKSWWEWRTRLEEDRRLAHAELTKRLDAHHEDIRNVLDRLARLERNGTPYKTP